MITGEWTGSRAIALPPDIAAQTYFDAIDAASLTSYEIEGICLADDDAAPFTEINSDADCSYITWVKELPVLDTMSLNRPVFESYLYSLMPELSFWEKSRRGKITLEWSIDDARAIPLGELTSRLSPTTVGLVTGEITLSDLYSGLLTPENEALISALINNKAFRHTGDNLLDAIMDGTPAALADGLL